jgi:hypothetical protein
VTLLCIIVSYLTLPLIPSVKGGETSLIPSPLEGEGDTGEGYVNLFIRVALV